MHGQAGIRGVRVESDATTNYYARPFTLVTIKPMGVHTGVSFAFERFFTCTATNTSTDRQGTVMIV